MHRQQTDPTTPAKPEESKHVLSRPRSRSTEAPKRLAGVALALALTALALLSSSIFQLPSSARAQSAPTVTDGGVESSFPDRLVFRASAESSSEIEKVRLRYKILPDGSSASGEAEFQPGTSISATLVLQGPDQPVFYLAPGTTIEYHWEVTDADGNTGRTEEASFFYDDDRFQWSHLDQGGVTIYYYAGSEDDAQAMLDVAERRIQETGGISHKDLWAQVEAEDKKSG